MLNSSLSPEELSSYITFQINNFFPDGKEWKKELLQKYTPTALNRLHKCINAVKMWKNDYFDHMHSSQYTIFLYFLSNSIWKAENDNDVCTRLFYLNKTLNGIDLFYEIEMPEIFFIGHSVGIVLSKATYGNYFVVYQNCTVGKNHGVAPVLGEGVIMYPNSAIIGRSKIGDFTVVSQGCSIINQDIQSNGIVFARQRGGLIRKDKKANIIEDIFLI